MGYEPTRTVFIPNGFNCDLYRPSTRHRRSVRAELGIAEQDVVIGLVARYHKMKDHYSFFAAAAELKRRVPNIKLLLAGPEVDGANTSLAEMVKTAGLSADTFLLGERDDLYRLYPAMDIATSASRYGEGFSNAIGEAMSSALPCVVTDVGDSAWLVGATGKVVPPMDVSGLANAWESLVTLGGAGRKRLGEEARKRIVENFALPAIVDRYENLYASVVNDKSIPMGNVKG